MEAQLESQLIRRAREGSSDALNELFGRYGERLLVLVRLRLGQKLRRRLDSQDILQETFLKAFERIEQFDGSSERTLMAWLSAIARHEILDRAKYFRRQARDVGRDVALDEVRSRAAGQVRTEVSRIHLRKRIQQLERALLTLREEHREVILLRDFEELSFPQIAKQMGRSGDACRMLHARAMAALTLKVHGLDEGD